MARGMLIINPVAGNARPDAARKALEQRVDDMSLWEIYETKGSEELSALVRQRAGEGIDVFVAAGGDGTVGAVASGLVHTQSRLAIIPSGTANVIAHDTGVPERLDEAFDLVFGESEIVHLDALQICDDHAFLSVSVGISVGLLRHAHPKAKKRLGRLAYVWSLLKSLAAIDVVDVDVTVDGKAHTLAVSEVIVTNCPSLGLPELRVAEEIRPDDGRMEVIAFRARHLGDYWGLFRDLVVRRSPKRRHVHLYPAHDQVIIEAASSMEVQADGDLIGATPVSIRLVPSSVQLIAPRDRARGRSRDT